MNRLKIFFAVVLLVLALPFWRFTDMTVIASPFQFPVTFGLTFWFAIFIGIPLKLLLPKFKTPYLLMTIGTFGLLSWFTPALSGMASDNPDSNHCGSLTYTGTFYSLRNILSDAHRDDLEARNQLCWVRKLISKVPGKFDTLEEITSYNELIRKKLLKPEMKYRVSLPLIAVLYFRINTSGREMIGVKEIYDSLHFWINHYTDEISSREYSIWNWPHSSYIQWEYGLVEKNWESLIQNIVISD